MSYLNKIPDRIKLYAFDFDGTLVNSLDDLSITVNIILTRYLLPNLSRKIVMRCVGDGSKKLLQRAAAVSVKISKPNTIPKVLEEVRFDLDPFTIEKRTDSYPLFSQFLDEIYQEYQDVYFAQCDKRTVLYPGIEEWLRNISETGKFAAIITNKPDAAVKKVIKTLDIEKYFSCIMTPESSGVCKPDPTGLYIAMRKTNVNADETVMIGDSVVDVAVGKAAGTLTCAIYGGFEERINLLAAAPNILLDRYYDSRGY